MKQPIYISVSVPMKVIIDTYNSQNQIKENHSDITKEIDLLNDKVRKARELLLAGNIDGSDQ
jgi:hypothetical protein